MLVLAMLAGVFIAFGSIISLVAQSGMDDVGSVQLMAGAAFSVGLMLVMVVGAELFTGNTLMALPVVTGELAAGRMLGAWTMVWIGNLIGSVLAALLFWGAGGLTDGVADAAVSLIKASSTRLRSSPSARASSPMCWSALQYGWRWPLHPLSPSCWLFSDR